ncbi:MAG: hypothetical protein IKO52_05520, partial [Clostridia bacterium]|nr:hypothetical protein [Clostridia bacterium]
MTISFPVPSGSVPFSIIFRILLYPIPRHCARRFEISHFPRENNDKKQIPRASPQRKQRGTLLWELTI